MLNSHSAGGLGGVDGQDVHSHYVRDCVEDGTVRIEKVHTDDNTGDLTTKPPKSRPVMVRLLKQVNFEIRG